MSRELSDQVSLANDGLVDDAMNARDALNKKIADTKADILELLASRGLLGWKDAGLANGYLTDLMSDITFDEMNAINEELHDAEVVVARTEERDLHRPVVL